MGVLRQYYKKFAKFLAMEGLQVYSYDYRGIGGSRPKSLKDFKANVQDWGAIDMESMVAYIQNTHASLPLLVVGHSVGGQVFGLAPSCTQVRALMLVGSQLGNWVYWDKGQTKLKFFWKYVLPGLTKLFGYFPAKKLGMFEDLPKGVALEWSQWGGILSICLRLIWRFPKSMERFHPLYWPGVLLMTLMRLSERSKVC